MVLHCLKTCEGEPLGEPYTFLGNERPSQAICIGIRRIGCFIFILYNIVVDLVMEHSMAVLKHQLFVVDSMTYYYLGKITPKYVISSTIYF